MRPRTPDTLQTMAAAQSCFKPRGIPLNVWRATATRGTRRTSSVPVSLPIRPKPACTDAFDMVGALSGWRVEVRTIKGGRQYRVYIDPAGKHYSSYVAALRAVK